MPIEYTPSISTHNTRTTSSGATTAHALKSHLTNLAQSKLPTHELPSAHDSTIKPSKRTPYRPLAPPPKKATIEELERYLKKWVLENPQTHTEETCEKILFFLNSLDTENPQNHLEFDHTTIDLPDIFHTKLLKDHLTSLSIHSDKITKLPSLPLRNLLRLDLKGCTKLTELPPDLDAAHKLARLDLNGCKGLTSIPEEMASLNKLTITGLGDCVHLALIPEALLNKTMGNGQTLLTQAILDGDETGVKRLTKLGASLSQSAGNGATPMTLAVLENDVSMVRLLKNLGADINQPAANGDTPLVCAVDDDNIELMEILLHELGADLNQPAGNSTTPLIFSINKGDMKMVEWLIRNGADMTQASGSGFSPLAIAILKNNTDAVKLLIASGIKVNEPVTLEGETPLILATITENPNMVKLLLSLKASIDLPGQDGEPPIAKALIFDLPEMVHLLKRLGANLIAGEKLVNTKFLAHAWGMKGTYPTESNVHFQLEYLPAIYSMRMLEKYASDFFKSEDFLGDPVLSRALSKENQKNILKAIAAGFPRSANDVIGDPLSTEDADDIVTEINLGKPFVILAGTVSHGISMVLHEDMLILFNRGEGHADASIRAYHLPASILTPEIIQQLTYNRYRDTPAFYDMIDQLKLKPADWGWSYTQKPQLVAHCSWAALKGAFGILCKLFASPEVTGEMIYKKFTTFVRKKTFEEFQLEYKSEPILRKIKRKGVKKGIFPDKKNEASSSSTTSRL